MTPMVVQGIHTCVNKLIFDSAFRDRVAVPFGTGSRNIAHGGRNQFNQIVTGLIPGLMNGAGGGARATMDGTDGAGFWFSGLGDTLDVEHEELRTPFLYMYRNIPRDQGGFGKYRGGAGVSNCLLVHNPNSPYSMVSLIVTARFPVDQGLFGGYAAGISPVIEVKEGGWHELLKQGSPKIPTNFHDLAERQEVPGSYQVNSMIRRSPFHHGESVAMIASSAGGYGDVLERSLDLIAQDLRLGFISAKVAEQVYKVAVVGQSIDATETNARREQERSDRKRRGRPYSQFLAQWQTKRPRSEIIQQFGPWPETP